MKRHRVLQKKKKSKLPYCALFTISVTSDSLSTEKELDALIVYLYGQKIIQDH